MNNREKVFGLENVCFNCGKPCKDEVCEECLLLADDMDWGLVDMRYEDWFDEFV